MIEFDRSWPYSKWPVNELWLEATRFTVPKDTLMALRREDIVRFLEMNAIRKSEFLDSVDDLILSYGTRADPLTSESVIEEIRTNFMETMESSGALRIDDGDDGDEFVFIFSKKDWGNNVSTTDIRRAKDAGYGIHYVGHSMYLGDENEYGIIVRFGE